MNFSHYISEDFVSALNKLYAQPEGSWWRGLLSDPEIFVAIRSGVLNAYYRGCSLAEIRLEGQEVRARTHYKYLLRAAVKPAYIEARSGQFKFPFASPEEIGTVFIHDLAQTKELKRAAKPYGGDEKKLVGDIIKLHPNVFDVEIGLTAKAEDSDDTTAHRIDLAALRYTKVGMELVMYEVKLFSNPELRAQGEDVSVLRQIERYEKLLDQHNDHIRESCVEAAKNVLMLEGIAEPRTKWAKEVIKYASAFSVCREPILIIGDFDIDQARGLSWSPHLKKLLEALGKDRVLARGSAKAVKLAPGQPPESQFN